MEPRSEMSESNEINLIVNIKLAFEGRKLPTVLTTSKQMSPNELDDLRFISRLSWGETTCEIWEKYFDVPSCFSPEAFCYYLPGILKATTEEKQPNLIVVSSIINDLDRSPNREGWDVLFLERWPLLTMKELCVVQDWLWWLSSFDKISHSDSSLMRALQTLELLAEERISMG